jgi:predicted DNA-binding transcriptional regulator YafY
MSGLDELIGELERAAARLRSGELSPDEAAALVERCAELAGRVDSELERQARAAGEEPLPGQEELL